MNKYLHEVLISDDRYKIFCLACAPNETINCIDSVKSQGIFTINIGNELAKYLNSLEDYSYLSIDVYDFIKKLLDNHKHKVSESTNTVIAIYNLGILLEPQLELDAAKLLKEFSKSSSLILIWQFKIADLDLLTWPTQTTKYFFDFSDATLKKIQYAV